MDHRGGNLTLMVLALSLGVVSCAYSDPEQEWSRPYGGWHPGAEPFGITAILVIDGETGDAMPGARILHHEESIHPLVIEPPFLGETTTDAFGLASLDTRGPPGEHWTVDAPGHAPAHSYGFDAREVFQVWPGRTIGGRLLAPSGIPLVGVELHLFLNCSHGPIMRRATTDSHGRFSMDHVLIGLSAEDLDSPDVYPQSLAVPGHLIEGGEWLDPERLVALGSGVVALVARPSAEATGVVVDEALRPIEGCVVRGPRWFDAVRTGPDGAFRLSGLGRDGLAIFHASHEDGDVQPVPPL